MGGNLPVDSAVFLGKHCLFSAPLLYANVITIEFVPASHQYLLTVLSIWWAFGQLIGSLVRPDIPVALWEVAVISVPTDCMAIDLQLFLPQSRG